MSLVVRLPKLADVDRLAVVNVETWRAAYAGVITQSRLDGMDLDDYRDRWRRNVTEPTESRHFLVAEVDGAVQTYGIAGSYRPQDPDDDTAATRALGEVYALYTHPQAQGGGAGKAVHDAMLGALARDGFAEVALWVLEGNVAGRAWYAQQSWTEDGATSDFVAHDVAHPELRLRHPLPASAPGPASPGR